MERGVIQCSKNGMQRGVLYLREVSIQQIAVYIEAYIKEKSKQWKEV